MKLSSSTGEQQEGPQQLVLAFTTSVYLSRTICFRSFSIKHLLFSFINNRHEKKTQKILRYFPEIARRPILVDFSYLCLSGFSAANARSRKTKRRIKRNKEAI
jgi:hypothetical protein